MAYSAVVWRLAVTEIVTVFMMDLGAGQPATQTVVLQAKSFISKMATDAAVSSGRPDDTTNRALGFADMVGGRVQAYELLLATDMLFSEKPRDGAQSAGMFRLWSELTINGSCAGGMLQKWSISAPKMAIGKEGSLQASGAFLKPLTVSGGQSGTGPRSSVGVNYALKGRPHGLVMPAFENIRPRSCSWIWHEVKSDVLCSGSSLVVKSSIVGSAFPSHMLWQDGKVVDSKPQGAFENLWKCDGSSPDLVK